MRRYFIHPESACAWYTDDDSAQFHDPLVEEVSYEEYIKACAAYGEDPEDNGDYKINP